MKIAKIATIDEIAKIAKIAEIAKLLELHELQKLLNGLKRLEGCVIQGLIANKAFILLFFLNNGKRSSSSWGTPSLHAE